MALRHCSPATHLQYNAALLSATGRARIINAVQVAWFGPVPVGATTLRLSYEVRPSKIKTYPRQDLRSDEETDVPIARIGADVHWRSFRCSSDAGVQMPVLRGISHHEQTMKPEIIEISYSIQVWNHPNYRNKWIDMGGRKTLDKARNRRDELYKRFNRVRIIEYKRIVKVVL